ncbi:hypothetical protein Dimus_004961 [Dionaea muscipula]
MVDPAVLYLEGDEESMVLVKDDHIGKESGKVRKLGLSKFEEKVGIMSTVSGEQAAGRLVSHLGNGFMAITIAPINKLKVPSRYLSGPFVSCHSLCKYGSHQRNNFEDKEMEKGSSLLRRSTSGCHALGKSTISTVEDRKSKATARRLSFPSTRAYQRQNTLLVEGIDQKNKLKPSARRVGVGVGSNIPSSSPRTPNSVRSKHISEIKMEKKIVVLESLLCHKNGKGVESFCKAGADRKSMGSVDGAFVSIRLPFKKAASMNPRIYRKLDGLPHMRKLNNIKKVNQRDDDASEKTLYVIEPNEEDEETKAKGAAGPIMHANSSPRSPKRKQVSKTKESKGSQTSIPNADQFSTTSKIKSSSQPWGREQGYSWHRYDGRKNDSVLRGGKPTTYKLEAKSDIEQLKEKVKRGISRSAGEKTSIWKKMKFRTEIMVAILSPHSSPKKSYSREAKVSGENQRGDDDAVAGSRSFGEKEDRDYNESHQTIVEPEKVILRHQETSSGRRDSLNLNNVIEETASELVKTRKK